MTGSVAPSTQGIASIPKITFMGMFIWSIAAVFFLYEFFLRTVLGSLEPQVMKSLHLNAETFSLLGSCYYLTYGLMQVPAGIIVDRLGVKLTMVFATIVCGLSAIAFGYSESFLPGFFSRMAMGFGSSFAFICLLVIARTWFPKENFGLFAGLSQFIGTMGPILAGGPLVLFLGAEGLSWRDCIIWLGGGGFGLAVLSFLFVKGQDADREGGGLIFMQRFMPLKDQMKSLFKNGQAWTVAVYSALIYTSIATLGAIWGTRVLMAKGFPQENAAEIISFLWVGYAVGCPVSGYISDTLHNRKRVLLFLALLAFFSTGFLALVPSGTMLSFGLIFFFIGFSGGGQNVGFATIVEKVTERLTATSMGLNNGLMLIFDTINPVIFGFLVTLTLANKNAESFTSKNFDYALMYIPALCLLAFFICLFFIRETYCKPQADVIIVKPATVAAS